MPKHCNQIEIRIFEFIFRSKNITVFILFNPFNNILKKKVLTIAFVDNFFNLHVRSCQLKWEQKVGTIFFIFHRGDGERNKGTHMEIIIICFNLDWNEFNFSLIIVSALLYYVYVYREFSKMNVHKIYFIRTQIFAVPESLEWRQV